MVLITFLALSLLNHRVVGKIVVKLSEIEFYDVTAGELKKCGKFETVLVSSSQ